MAMIRRKFRAAVLALFGRLSVAVQSHVNGSITVMVERGEQAASEAATSLFGRLKELYAANFEQAVLELVTAGSAGSKVFVTVSSAAMRAQSGQGAHNPMVVSPAVVLASPVEVEQTLNGVGISDVQTEEAVAVGAPPSVDALAVAAEADAPQERPRRGRRNRAVEPTGDVDLTAVALSPELAAAAQDREDSE